MTTAVRTIRAAAGSGRRFEEYLLRRRWRVVVFCGLVGFSLAALGGAWPPAVHDEFSYLLAADTFASGRLSNPTHPLWRHFETFHVLSTPTYSSKYPPGQALVLALGMRLAGSPALGVWLSCGAMVAALTWMLQAWVPPRWALWGGVSAALWIVGQHAFDGYWASSYWGGSVAATGGALALGAVKRLARRTTAIDSAALGAGLAVLAISRPFEGLLFSTVPIGLVGWVLIGQLRRRQWALALRSAGPALLILLLTAGFVAAHNRAVTGSITEFPYQRYARTYDSSPILMWQQVPEPIPRYAVPEMEALYTRGHGYMRAPARWRDVPAHYAYVSLGWRFYLPIIALPLVLALPWSVRKFWGVVAVASLGSVLVASAVTLAFWWPHYVAPAVAPIAILYVGAARLYSRLHRWGIRGGRIVNRMIFASLVISTLINLFTDPATAGENHWSSQRAAMQRRLAASGPHYVLVEYGPAHDFNREWVYNAADIDASAVVWARSLGAEEDAAFARYFADRRGWRLRVDNDSGPFVLTPVER